MPRLFDFFPAPRTQNLPKRKPCRINSRLKRKLRTENTPTFTTTHRQPLPVEYDCENKNCTTFFFLALDNKHLSRLESFSSPAISPTPAVCYPLFFCSWLHTRHIPVIPVGLYGQIPLYLDLLSSQASFVPFALSSLLVNNNRLIAIRFYQTLFLRVITFADFCLL